MTHIWRSAYWPQFEWKLDNLASGLVTVLLDQGPHWPCEEPRLSYARGDLLRALTDDVVKSSAIEGERLDEQQVRSSLARRLGIDIDGFVTPDRSVEDIVHITLDATIDCSEPLTTERLFQWHAALFPIGPGPISHFVDFSIRWIR